LKSKMKHLDYVEGFEGTLKDLASKVGKMRYDRVEQFLEALAADIESQADADKERGRSQLSEVLYRTAENLRQGKTDMAKAWKICKPYMKSDS